MKFEIFKFKSVTSTNDVAIRLIQKESKNFGVIYSKKQTKGRGTHGKKWISKSGNLFISIFLYLVIPKFFNYGDKTANLKNYLLENTLLV